MTRAILFYISHEECNFDCPIENCACMIVHQNLSPTNHCNFDL